jgi:hypothetical protein
MIAAAWYWADHLREIVAAKSKALRKSFTPQAGGGSRRRARKR